MKSMKRIFAISGIIILVALYASTLVFALLDSPQTYHLLKISIGLTILIPVLLWIYIAMFRFMEQRKHSNEDASNGSK